MREAGEIARGGLATLTAHPDTAKQVRKVLDRTMHATEILAGIKLTREQQTAIDAIQETWRVEIRKTADLYNSGQDAMRAAYEQACERRQTAIRGVLTAEQRKQFDANLTIMAQSAK